MCCQDSVGLPDLCPLSEMAHNRCSGRDHDPLLAALLLLVHIASVTKCLSAVIPALASLMQVSPHSCMEL